MYRKHYQKLTMVTKIAFGVVLVLHAAYAYAAGGGGAGNTFIIEGMLGLIIAIIGLYSRYLGKEMDSKVDKEAFNTCVREVNNTRVGLHDLRDKVHNLSLHVAEERATKDDVRDAVSAAIAPLAVKIDAIQKALERGKEQ